MASKPASVAIKEAKENIYDAIRASELHPAVVEMIISEIYDNVHAQAAKIAEREAEEYQMALIREQNEQNEEITQESNQEDDQCTQI